MNTTTNPTAPNIGDKIIPLAHEGNWFGIPEWYQDKIGTVTEVTHFGDHYVIDAEFTSQQKPDDEVRWSFRNYRLAPYEGATVRVTQTGPRNLQGKIGTIETDDKSSIPYYVVGVYDSDPKDGIWMYPHQVEVVRDSETLTVSSHPVKIGDYIGFSGVLTDDGVDNSISGAGVVVEASDGVYTVQTARTRSWVTGDGAVYGAVKPDDRIGRLVEVGKIDPAAPGFLLGKSGVVTGIHVTGKLQVTFGRDVEQYEGHFPGAWAIQEDCLTEGTILETDIVPAVPVEPAIITDLQAQIDEKDKRIASLEENNRILMKSVDDWTHDFDCYAERIVEQAVERDWCSEYESVIRGISSELRVATIPDRDEEVEITYREKVEIEVDRSFSIRLPRGYTSEDVERAARDRANDSSNDPDVSDIVQAVRNGSYSCEGYVEDSADED